jgi:hypothetical protein
MKRNKGKTQYHEIASIDYYFDFVEINADTENKLRDLLNEWPVVKKPNKILNYDLNESNYFPDIDTLLKELKIAIKQDYESWGELIANGKSKLKYFVSKDNLYTKTPWLFAEADRIVEGKKEGSILYGTPLLKTEDGFYFWDL